MTPVTIEFGAMGFDILASCLSDLTKQMHVNKIDRLEYHRWNNSINATAIRKIARLEMS